MSDKTRKDMISNGNIEDNLEVATIKTTEWKPVKVIGLEHKSKNMG